ncbi:MAG TPA: YbjN domain-containing protein [Candidatus Nanopelagicaceae bacterium]
MELWIFTTEYFLPRSSNAQHSAGKYVVSINPRIIIEEFLDSHALEYERSNEDTFLLTLPGEKKLQTHCALVVGDYSLSINAFIIRKPDENQTSVYEWCMKRNAQMYGVAYALNEVGDIFLVGRLPLGAVTDREIDRLLGSVLQNSDSAFNPLLEMGFASAIRREWAWRVSRGESLANLKAFEHLV